MVINIHVHVASTLGFKINTDSDATKTVTVTAISRTALESRGVAMVDLRDRNPERVSRLSPTLSMSGGGGAAESMTHNTHGI